jgi:hypothetical protein
MKRTLLVAVAIFISAMIFAQAPLTPAHSFETHITGAPGMTEAQIESNISKISFENYRLKNKRTTLTFDNGFEIVMFSAAEAQSLGIPASATYPEDFIAKYKMPVFHMTPDGKVGAAYSAATSKYTSHKK